METREMKKETRWLNMETREMYREAVLSDMEFRERVYGNGFDVY